MRSIPIIGAFIFLMYCGGLPKCHAYQQGKPSTEQKELRIIEDRRTGTLAVYRKNDTTPVVTQIAKEDLRPYIHPIVAPDGKGILTQFSPEHHKHQTGLYWGLKRVNGRDYFMNWQGDYWRRISAKAVKRNGHSVQWQTTYDLLDELGNRILTETQNWSMQEHEGKYVLDLEWEGEAKQDVVIGKFYVGGLFLRMPWHKGITGEVINAAGQRNNEAEAQRANWLDIGLQVEGREDLAHVAIFDHPANPAFPTPWRVDNELGVGPSRQILGDWQIGKGKTAVFRYRLIVYTGALRTAELTRRWMEYNGAQE
jgi:hypothetical protein